MSKSEITPGIHEVQTFEVDQFNCIRGVLCGGQSLLEAKLIQNDGQVPFEAIFSDSRTRTLYSDLVEHVRSTSETISFPYRCDSETHSVYLRAVVFLSSSKNVGFLNKVTGYDTRPVGIKLVRIFVNENDDYRCCSICNRFSKSEHENTEWYEFQTMVETGLYVASTMPMRCIYDVCTDCESAVRQRMSETIRSFERRAA